MNEADIKEFEAMLIVSSEEAYDRMKASIKEWLETRSGPFEEMCELCIRDGLSLDEAWAKIDGKKENGL